MYNSVVTPGSPQLAIIDSSQECLTGKVVLGWTPPINTGKYGDEDIEHYVLNVTGPSGYTCLPEQCNVTTTNTTISGLLCNTSYNVTVRAVNCIGEGDLSEKVEINERGLLYTCTCWMYMYYVVEKKTC